MIKKLSHEDVVLFSTREQIDEYIELSGDDNFSERELRSPFPQIQSKHWSFNLHDPEGTWEIKETALARLVSYELYKERNHQSD